MNYVTDWQKTLRLSNMADSSVNLDNKKADNHLDNIDCQPLWILAYSNL